VRAQLYVCWLALLLLQVYTVTLHGEQLRTDFRVMNTGDTPFEFTTALHTYFEVLHVDKAKVRARQEKITQSSK
jgi:D-hexose-6-phosphate mutarotase